MDFDANKWLEKYQNLVSQIKQGNYEARKLLAEEQVKIFEQTVEVGKIRKYISQNGFNIEIKNSDNLIKNSKFYSDEFNVNNVSTINETTEINV